MDTQLYMLPCGSVHPSLSWSACPSGVSKKNVSLISSSSSGGMGGQIIRHLPFLFFQNSFIFRFFSRENSIFLFIIPLRLCHFDFADQSIVVNWQIDWYHQLLKQWEVRITETCQRYSTILSSGKDHIELAINVAAIKNCVMQIRLSNKTNLMRWNHEF